MAAIAPTVAVDADDDSSDFEPDAKRRRAAAAQRGSRAIRAAGAGQKAGLSTSGGGGGSGVGGGGGKRRKAAAVKKPALGRVKRCSNKQVWFTSTYSIRRLVMMMLLTSKAHTRGVLLMQRHHVSCTDHYKLRCPCVRVGLMTKELRATRTSSIASDPHITCCRLPLPKLLLLHPGVPTTRQVELVEAGRAVGGKGWQNKGYIFPDGFRSRTVFRSSVDPEQVPFLF